MSDNNRNNAELQIGLQLINLPYEEQLKQKKMIVEKLIRNVTKVNTTNWNFSF